MRDTSGKCQQQHLCDSFLIIKQVIGYKTAKCAKGLKSPLWYNQNYMPPQIDWFVKHQHPFLLSYYSSTQETNKLLALTTCILESIDIQTDTRFYCQ